MRNITLGLVFGIGIGLLLAGMYAHAECCGMLDVPLNDQIEIEFYDQYTKTGRNAPRPAEYWGPTIDPCVH